MVLHPNRMRKMTTQTKLDQIDAAILAALQKNARLSNKELAAQVGLAPSSCLERVRKLEQAGVITGYHAQVAMPALGIHLQAMVYVELGQHTRETFDAFLCHVRGLREVTAVYNMAGRWDFLVHVAVPTTDHLKTFALDALTARPEVSRVETSLIFAHHRQQVLPHWDQESR